MAQLKKLAFKRFERCGPLVERFHKSASKIDRHPDTAVIWQGCDWLCAPLSLWPIDFEGVAKCLLTQIEQSSNIDSDLVNLIEIVGPPPNQEASRAVAEFEHMIEAGSYDHLFKTPEKFAENELAINENIELQKVWSGIKARWDKVIVRNSRGVIRRRLSQERNLRGDWQFNWEDSRKQFELFFDAMCYRWKLYGMEYDKPLLLKISVNPTPHGTMIVIPRHLSINLGLDLDWKKIGDIHRAHGASRQGPKLSRARIQTHKEAKEVLKLWDEAKIKGFRGDARYDYVHNKMKKRLETDHSWVNRLLRIARGKKLGGKK